MPTRHIGNKWEPRRFMGSTENGHLIASFISSPGSIKANEPAFKQTKNICPFPEKFLRTPLIRNREYGTDW